MMKKQRLIIAPLILMIMTSANSYNKKHLKIFINEGYYEWRKKNAHTRLDLSRAVLRDMKLGGNIQNINFRYSKILGGRIFIGKFKNCDFSYATLKNIRIDIYMSHLTTFDNIKFVKAKIIDCKYFNYGKYISANFSGAELINSNLGVSTFINVNFNGIKMQNSSLSVGSLTKSKMINANFKNARIVKSAILGKICHADFSNSYIFESNIGGYAADADGCINVNFKNAKIINSTIYSCQRSTFIKTHFLKSVLFTDFKNVNFINAKMIECQFQKFYGKNLSFINANLTKSSFKKAKLTNANFTNASLADVDFAGATFKNVIFKNADMKGAKIERKWYNYIKRQGVRNFDKIIWVG